MSAKDLFKKSLIINTPHITPTVDNNMEYLSMLPGPTNVPNRVMRAMLAPIINHRSDDFVELYTDVVEKTQQVFETTK